MAFERARYDEPVAEDVLADYRSFAASGAALGLPVTNILTDYEAGVSLVLSRVWSDAQPGEQLALARYTQWVANAAEGTITGMADAYLGRLRADGFGGAARADLARALVAGTASASMTAALGLPWSEPYLVMAVSLRAETAQDLTNLSDVAALPAEGHSLLLQPIAMRSAIDPGAWRKHAELLVDRLPELAACAVADIAVSAASIPTVASAVRRAASLARDSGYSAAELVHPDHLVLASYLATDPELRSGLVRLAAPLRDQSELGQTLRLLYDCDLDRGRTAARLRITRRALTYRLQRITRITGLDPVSTRGIQLFSLALGSAEHDRSR